MNKIHAAYQKLGAHPGTEFDVIKRRYKMLVMVWHPDRLTTPEGKKVAEEEIKAINNAFDCIKKHFESGHRQGPSCECQPVTTQYQQTGAGHNPNTGCGHATGSGPAGNNQGHFNTSGYQREKTAYEKWAEQEARAKEAERRRAEESAHEAALKEALERARQAAEARATAAAAAKAKSQAAATLMTEEQLRWRLSVAIGVIFLFLLIGGFNKRYEPSSSPNSESSLSEKVEHLRPCPF
ncbi:MAG: J domain-containing protein [Candidatus Obscuribacterales bacterium]|nr:J domain-containing protein [Candidatus Obscuribacterales bacterium]